MSNKDQGSRARVHSISDGLTLVCLFVCMEFNLFLYIVLNIVLSFHWPLMSEAFCSPDIQLLSCMVVMMVILLHVWLL